MWLLDGLVTQHIRILQYRYYWLLAGAATCAIIVALNTTFVTMLKTWLVSTSFNHCFLIPPASAYLVWLRRKRLAKIEPQASIAGLAAAISAAAVWILGELAGTAIVQGFAAVSLIQFSIWAILGTSMAREIMFPLGYLFFMVPAGHFLIPVLMDYTADFAVVAVRLSGISVYRDGLFFMIPEGSFRIVEACSGIRMLIASLAIGALFAYLNFNSWKRRIGYVIAVSLLALVANGIRAYFVVMTAHFRGMDAVADHVVVGYVVFSIVIVAMLVIGRHFSDKRDHDESNFVTRAAAPEITAGSLNSLVITIVIVSLVFAIPIVAAPLVERNRHAQFTPPLELPAAAAGWLGPNSIESDWAPTFYGDTATEFGGYRNSGSTVTMYTISYLSQGDDSELINERNRPFDDTHWTLIRARKGITHIPGMQPIEYDESEIQAGTRSRRLVRHWYVIDGQPRLNGAAIKLVELKNALLGNPTQAGVIVISTPIRNDASSAQRALDSFMADMLGPD